VRILGIETSCDETAAAVVVDGAVVVSNVISSQIDSHAPYGGVIPELAAREHLRNIDHVADAALREAGVSLSELDAIAVTNEPGLVPALLVGVSYAKGLAAATGLPLIGINHFLAHLYAAFLPEPQILQDPALYPLLGLIVSGGHTALLRVAVDGELQIIGQTLDDAAGEAFDKAAKILQLPYPGGPQIDRLAEHGDPRAIKFPRSLTGTTGRRLRAEDRFNFSFSGVKTSLLYHVDGRAISGPELADIAASYQAAIVDVLVSKSMDAAIQYQAPCLVVAGGVACNRELRQTFRRATAAAAAAPRLMLAAKPYCTDNAAMVAALAYHYIVDHDAHSSRDALAMGVAARLTAAVASAPFAPAWRRH